MQKANLVQSCPIPCFFLHVEFELLQLLNPTTKSAFPGLVSPSANLWYHDIPLDQSKRRNHGNVAGLTTSAESRTFAAFTVWIWSEFGIHVTRWRSGRSWMPSTAWHCEVTQIPEFLDSHAIAFVEHRTSRSFNPELQGHEWQNAYGRKPHIGQKHRHIKFQQKSHVECHYESLWIL
jgi:hypothetical protein